MNDDATRTLPARRSPLLYLAAALAAGIAIEHYARLPLIGLMGFALGLSLLALAGSRLPRFALLSVYMSFVAAGALMAEVEMKNVRQSPLRSLYEREPERFDAPVELEGRLAGAPVRAQGGVYLDLDVSRISFGQQAGPIAGNVRLTVHAYDDQMREELARLRLRPGTRLRAWAELTREEGYRNPGSSDLNEYLDRIRVDCLGSVKSGLLIQVTDRNGEGGWLNKFEEARVRGEAAIDRLFPSRTAGLLKALLLGNRYFIDRDTSERFRAGGTFHVLVISGTQVSFIAAGLYWILGGLTCRRWLQAAILMISIWSYALVVGLDQAPIVRASVMISAILMGRVIFRSSPHTNSIGLAALILLMAAPSDLFSASFQLTFIAVLGIALIALPPWERLKQIGAWQPQARNPQPPGCAQRLRRLAEFLFWDERRFVREMAEAPVRYRLDKTAWAARLGWIPSGQPLIRFFAISTMISMAVQLAMLPASVFYFHRITPSGIFINIVVSLLTAMTMASGLLTCAIAAIAEAWAKPFAHATHHLGSWLVMSPQPFLDLPFAQFRVAEYRGENVAIYLLFCAALGLLIRLLDQWRPVETRLEVEMDSKARTFPDPASRVPFPLEARGAMRWLTGVRRWRAVFCAVWLFGSAWVIVWHPGGAVYRPGWLCVNFLDVGQGDSMLVQFPNGETMLIDGGGRFQPLEKNEGELGEESAVEDRPRVGEAVVARFLWRKGLDRIDYLVPTHADLDHIQGCSDIVRNFSVGQVWLAREPTHDRQFDELLDALQERRTPVRRIKRGDRLAFGTVEVEVLWPQEIETEPLEWKNDDSVVMRVRYGERSVLFTGDLGSIGEAALMSAGGSLESTILKVPHHGSRTSSSPPFVAAVRPEWAIISVGRRSPFGHPHPEVIETYRSMGIPVLRTGDLGMVTVSTNGHEIEIASFVAGPIRRP